MGGVIHILLVIAIVVVVIQAIQGDKCNLLDPCRTRGGIFEGGGQQARKILSNLRTFQ